MNTTMPTAVDEMEARRLRRNADSRRWAKAHPDQVKAIGRKSYQDNIEERRVVGWLNANRWRQNNPAGVLMRNMKLGSAAKKMECTITREELEILLEPMVCALTGWSLRWDTSIPNDDLAPSPDRIDNSLGYVPGNVRIVAWRINRMRGNMSDERLLDAAMALLHKAGRIP